MLYGTFDVFRGEEVCGKLMITEEGLISRFFMTASLGDKVERLYCISESAPASVGVPFPRGGRLYLEKRFTKNDLKSLALNNIEKAVLIPIDQNPEAIEGHTGEPHVGGVPAGDVNGDLSAGTSAEASPHAQSPESPKAHLAPAEVREEDHSAAAKKDTPEPEPIVWMPEPEPGRHFSDPLLKSECAALSGALFAESGDFILIAFPFFRDGRFPLPRLFRYGEPCKINQKGYIVYALRGGVPVKTTGR